MSAIKGYPSKATGKNFEYVTIEPVAASQHGLSVNAYMFYEDTGSDAAEAGSTSSVIVATAHAARVGDLIRFTSGAANGYQAKVLSVATNSITLVEALGATPAAADTFDILRTRFPTVDQLGNTITSSLTQFTRDGVTTTVTEDTVTPANNIPLPVKLTSVTGDINITAGDLNVQTSHSAVNYDSMRIGDGTDLLDVVVEDAASAGGESGVLAMAVRNSAGAVTTSADGDFATLTVDDTGRLRVDATITEAATSADGGALPAVVKVIGGYDGANVQAIATDASGNLQVDVLTELATAADGAAAPAVSKVIAGVDGVGNTQTVSTDTNGRINVNVVDALPAGTNNIGDVDVLSEPATVADGGALPAVVKVVGGYDGANVQAIATDASGNLQVDVLTLPATFAEDAAHNSGDLGVQALAVRNDAGAALAGTDGDYIPLSTDATGNLRAVLAASTNNIGDVDVLSEPATVADGGVLPAVVKVVGGYDGANVQAIATDASGNLQVDVLTLPATFAEDAAHNSGDLGIQMLAVRNDGGSVLAGTSGDYIPLSTDSSGNLRVVGSISVGGKTVVTTIRNDYTSTSVTTGAWVQLVASTAAAITELEIFDSSGETLEIGTGAAAAETRLILVFPGGNGRVPVAIAAATRISIRAVSGTASVGELDINCYGV